MERMSEIERTVETDKPVKTDLLRDGVGDQFAPLLREACGGRLSSIGWFRADWQRGGAKTGRAWWDLSPGGDDEGATEDEPERGAGLGQSVKGRRVEVVVKIPVGPVEFAWNARMQPEEGDPHGITAKTYALSMSIGEYDLAWIVMERFPAGPLFGLKRKDALKLTADAAARFYNRAARYGIDRKKRVENWPLLLERARDACRNEALPNSQNWSDAIKSLQKHGKSWIDDWTNRPITGWIHGDLHPANVMSRSDDNPNDPAMLIDLAEVRPGHWIEDAVYLERIYWARRSILDGRDPVKLIGKARKRYGIDGAGDASVEGDVSRLATIRRALLAATAPAYLRSEGNPTYLAACLNVLETSIKSL